jgi:hypothetical protein
LPRQDRQALERTLDQVFRRLPTPAAGFRRDVEGDDREVTSSAAPRAADGGWLVPAAARSTRLYASHGANDEDLELEITVYVNQEASLSDPLGSAGGALDMDVRDEAPVVRHSLAGIDEYRVKLPFTDEDRANALTVVRIYVAIPDAKPYLSALAQGRRPPESPWEGATAKRASQVRTIVVEFYGPAREVDRLAEKTAIAPLRELISR